MAGSIDTIGKKFRVTFEFGKDEKGKRIRKFETFATEAEAKKALNEHNYKQQHGLLVKTTDVTLAEFLEKWMNDYVKRNCQDTTIYGYRNVIDNHIIPYFGSAKLKNLEPAHVQAYYNHLEDEKGLSPNTVHRHHSVLREALEHALKQHYVNKNAAAATTLPKKKKFVGKAYTKEQLKMLFEMVKDTKLELPVYLAGYLGLRREEVVGLKWKCIDLNERILYVAEVRTSAGSKVVTKEPKSEKSRRSLHIEDVLYTILLKHQERQKKFKEMLGSSYEDSGYVVVRDDGKPYRVNSVTEQFKEFLEKQDLPKIRFHDLRHTFASILHEAKVDIKSISEALGHSDIGITSRIYTHLYDKTHKDTVRAMSRALSM